MISQTGSSMVESTRHRGTPQTTYTLVWHHVGKEKSSAKRTADRVNRHTNTGLSVRRNVRHDNVYIVRHKKNLPPRTLRFSTIDSVLNRTERISTRKHCISTSYYIVVDVVNPQQRVEQSRRKTAV